MVIVITKHALERANNRGLKYQNKEQLRQAIEKAHKTAKLLKQRRCLEGDVYGTSDIVYAVIRYDTKIVVTTVFGTMKRYNWEARTYKRETNKYNRQKYAC